MASLPLPVRLVCPRCRLVGPDGRLAVRHLQPDQDRTGRSVSACVCPQCRTRYPMIQNVWCVPPDLPAFLEAQADAVAGKWLGREDSQAADLCRSAAAVDPACAEYRELQLPATYAAAHFPQSARGFAWSDLVAGNERFAEVVSAWVRKHVPAGTPGTALDAGCGPGRLLPLLAEPFQGGAIGLDLRLSMLRLADRVLGHQHTVVPFRAEGTRFTTLSPVWPGRCAAQVHLVQGDVQDPPFEAEAFAMAAAVSLLDSVPDPLLALGQIDAMLAPGGLLLLALPYQWDAQAVAPRMWWSGPWGDGAQVLHGILAGRHPALPHLRYAILAEEENLPWALPANARLVHHYFLHAVLARKLE
jgi:SAM-dependent methyltransferase